MRVFNGIAEAADAARVLVLGDTVGLHASAMGKLTSATNTGASPVDLIVWLAEAVYANRSDASPAAREIAAGCAVMCEQFRFHGMAEGSRGSKIALVLDGADVDGQPEPKMEWIEAEELSSVAG